MHPVTRPVITALFLAWTTFSQAATDFSACPQFFANAKPPVLSARPMQRALCYDAFAILHSGESKTAIYVAQKLNRASVADADEKRKDKFFADARLRSSERAELEDYKHSGWSRGHMAPAGDMPTVQAMAQSFSLANMVPQAAKHNGGAWANSVEAATRKYAGRASGDVYVITGPVYSPSIRESEGIGAGQLYQPCEPLPALGLQGFSLGQSIVGTWVNSRLAATG